MPDHDLTERTTALVTGAAGFLGLPLVRYLRSAGYSVVAVDDGSAGTLHRLARVPRDPALVVRVLDVRDRLPLMRLVASVRPSIVVHLAAHHFIPACEAAPADTLAVNVLGTQHLLDACAEHPPRRFLFASTADVYEPRTAPHDEDDPLGPRGVYGTSKLHAEMLLRDQAGRMPGCDLVLARLCNLYGPHDPHPHVIPEILSQIEAGKPVYLGDLGAARDFVHVEDAAEALSALLGINRVGTVNIGTGRATTVGEVVELIAKLTGRRFEVHTDDQRLRRFPRPSLCVGPAKLQRLLPWWPRTPLREGLRRTLAVHTHHAQGRCAS